MKQGCCGSLLAAAAGPHTAPGPPFAGGKGQGQGRPARQQTQKDSRRQAAVQQHHRQAAQQKGGGSQPGGQALPASPVTGGTAAAAGAFLTNVRSQFLSDHKCGLLFMFFPVFWFSYPYRPEKNKKVLLLQNFFLWIQILPGLTGQLLH